MEVLGESLKISFFAAADEAFGKALEVVPLAAYGLGFVVGNLGVGCGVGDEGEEIGELLDHAAGGWNEALVFGGVGLGILNEESAGLSAQPVDQTWVAGGLGQSQCSVEWVGDATGGIRAFGLGPFVKGRRGQVQLAGHIGHVGFLEGAADGLVGFHPHSLAIVRAFGHYKIGCVLQWVGRKKAGPEFNPAPRDWLACRLVYM